MVPADNLSVKLIDSLYKAKQLSQAETKLYEGFLNSTRELMKTAELSPNISIIKRQTKFLKEGRMPNTRI